jgi:dTDP-4-amino-4,6-dideoxygalactose transaminase
VTAIVPVHVLGHPVDLDRILAAAKKFGLKVIEDATEGLGATYKDRPLGSIGDIGRFSFNGNKIITWQPIYQSPAHAVSRSVGLPVSEQLSKEALSLPCSVGLSEDAQKEVINHLRLR